MTTTSGSGGSGGGGPLPVMTTMSFSMATDVCPVGSDANVQGCWKLVDSNAMVVDDALPDDVIEFQHNADEGNPEPGAFEATIPYDSVSQWVSFGINFPAGQDLTNRIISARVMVTGLGDATGLMTAPGGSKIYAKSGMEYCYANGQYNNLGDGPHPLGQWQTIQFNLLRAPDFVAECMSFDPSDIREIGIQFDSSPTATPETAVVLIDDVTF